MENYERKWIKKNLPDLVKNTNCNVLLLSYLQSKDILSLSDVEVINKKHGDLAKAGKLYQLLPKRAGSFDALLDALEHVRQTGALEILQKVAGPKWVLNPQRMFLSAGEKIASFLDDKKYNTLVISSYSTKLITDKILQNVPKSVLLTSSDVLGHKFELKPWIKVVVVHLEENWAKIFKKLSNFKGIKSIFVAGMDNKLLETIQKKYKGKIQYQKETICWAELNPTFQLELIDRVNRRCFGIDVSNVIEQLQETKLIEVIKNKECDLFSYGLPKPTSYYVDRTILYKNTISPSVFEGQTPDIWIFKNMKKNELASLAKGYQVDYTSNHIHQTAISNKFLVLDFNTDFDCICSKTKSTVHLIEKIENSLCWKETRCSLKSVLNCIEENVVNKLSEADFLEAIERNRTVIRNTVIISDTPGIGKSYLLENLGRKLQEKYSDRMVIFVVWSEFVDKFSGFSTLTIENILQALAKLVCRNDTFENIFQHLVSKLHIELLLDGFDEIKPEKIQMALDILSKLKENMPRIRNWVTTRPHYQKQLEEHCSTIAYQIAPLNEQNQIQFLNTFWMSSFKTSLCNQNQPNVSKNDIPQLNINLLKKFTIKCLRDIKNCLNQRDTDIVGIPLQCMLIAEALQEDAYRCSKFNNCNDSNALEASLRVNSISELYRLFVSTKIKYYLIRTQNSKIDLQALQSVHFHYSLLLLFPKQASKFNLQDNLDSINAADYLAVGILQAGHIRESPRFIHRTFAEYFVSEFCMQQMQKPVISECFLEFFFKTVMNTEVTLVFVPHVSNFPSAQFHEKTVCHFLNSSIEVVIKNNSLCNLEETLVTVYRNPITVQNIAHASAVDNFANVFKFLAVTKAFHYHRNYLVLDKHFLHIIVFKSTIGYIKACFKLYNLLQQKICNQVDDADPQAISDNLKQAVLSSWVTFNSKSAQTSLLHTAVVRGDSSIFLFLVQHTEIINVLKECPLYLQDLIHLTVENTLNDSHDKVESRNVIIKKLIELNPAFLHFKILGAPAILYHHVHVRLLEELLSAGADALSKISNKSTLWHFVAARPSCSDLYRLLNGVTDWAIRSKIVNAKDSNGDTVLQILVKVCNPEEKTLQLLNKCGADFNTTRNFLGFTPIFTAVSSFRDPNTILLLLQYGANIMSKNKSGLPIVHHAADVGNVNALLKLQCLFLEMGRNNIFSWRDGAGKTPLQYAQSQAPDDHVYGKQLCIEFLCRGYSLIDSSIYDSCDEDDSPTTVSELSKTKTFESWEYFRVVSLNSTKAKDIFKLIIYQPKEKNYHGFDIKCTEKQVTVYQQIGKKIKIERQTGIKGLTWLLESIIVLSRLLKFSLGILKNLLSNASSVAIGDLMVGWILDQHLTDDLIVSHLEWCILKGTDINSWSLNGSPLLNEIIKTAASTKPIKFLLDQGANIDVSDPDQNTVLHVLFQCSKCTEYEATLLLIESGANVLNRNANGDTPLMLLFKTGKQTALCTYFLLQSAGAISDSEIANSTMFWLVKCFSKTETIIGAFKYLINKGANLYWKQNENVHTGELISYVYGKDVVESLMHVQREYDQRRLTAQLDNTETIRAMKITFRRFASHFELTNPKLIAIDQDTNVDVSGYRHDVIYLDHILNEVYSNDMSDIAIIFAYVINSNSHTGLIFICNWCKKRDSSFTISQMKFKTTNNVDWRLLVFTVFTGSCECLEYLIENEGFKQQLFEKRYEALLHVCLQFEDPGRIIKYLLKINPSLLNGKHDNKTLFESEYLFPNAFLALVEAGANIDDFVISEINIRNCHTNGISIMHYLPQFVDSKKYHKFVQEIHSKQLLPTLFSNTEKSQGNTPLHAAILCFELDSSTVQLLVESGVDINTPNSYGYTPFISAVSKNYSLSFIQTMISMGADISKPFSVEDELQRTILHFMIQQYFLDSDALLIFLEFCFEQNLMCHFKACDKDGNSVLHYAFQYQNITADMIPLLLPDSSFICLSNKNNQTILHYATEYLDLPTYETMLVFLKSENMLFLFNYLDSNGNTPLHCLAGITEKSECISKHLIGEQKINFELKNKLGETFLHCFATNDVKEVTLEDLFSTGVDLYTQNMDGKTFVCCFIDSNSSLDIHTLITCLVKNALTGLLLNEFNEARLYYPVTTIEYGILQNKILPDTFAFLKSIGMNLNRVNSKTKTTLLHLAAETNDFHIIKCLINLGLDATQQDNHGYTFLHGLAFFGTASSFQDVVKFLTKHKINTIFSITNKLGETPLHTAAEERKLTTTILNLTTPHIADINLQNVSGKSLLHCAFVGDTTTKFDILLIQAFLEAGVNPALVDEHGDTFLHYAACSLSNTDFYALTKYVSSKCNAVTLFGIKNKIDGVTPLHVAVQNIEISVETFELLRSIAINFDVVSNKGFSILMFALAAKYSVSMLRYLIKNKYCNIYLKDYQGQTFAHHACSNLSVNELHEIVHCLISCGHGDRFKVVDIFNHTPLHFAVAKLEILPSTFDLLCGRTQTSVLGNANTNKNKFAGNKFVDLNAVDLNEISILHCAIVGNRSLKLVKHLIEIGANWEAKNSHNSNIALAAASFGNLELLEYFVQLGCDVNELDNDGDNALHCVIHDSSKNVYEIVDFLLRHGVDRTHVNKKGKTAYDYAIEKNISDRRVLNLLS